MNTPESLTFSIPPVSRELEAELRQKIDTRTKPPGSLGQLEAVALRLGLILRTCEPVLHKPTMVVFAGDHGIAAAGQVNAFPQAVTAQMVLNFLSGGAAINVFCRQHGIALTVVDAGVKYDFGNCDGLVHAKIAPGTRNYLEEPAMRPEECSAALAAGADLVRGIAAGGSNVIGFGEMGIGNTSSAALLMCCLTGLPLEDCVGSGTGLDDAGIARKTEILRQALARHPAVTSPTEILATFGGYELAMITGGMLAAAEAGMVIMVDGFIATASLLAARKMYPAVLDYCLFMHMSEEKGHRAMLEYLQAEPLLSLGMRLGEGSGAAVGYPLLVSATTFLNDMASFASAGVSDKE